MMHGYQNHPAMNSPSGNMKAPSRGLICNWVKSSWDQISEETIKKSFKSCGVNLPIDGTEDDSIHCFKEGQPCEEGRRMLREKMEELHSMAATMTLWTHLLQRVMMKKKKKMKY